MFFYNQQKFDFTTWPYRSMFTVSSSIIIRGSSPMKAAQMKISWLLLEDVPGCWPWWSRRLLAHSLSPHKQEYVEGRLGLQVAGTTSCILSNINSRLHERQVITTKLKSLCKFSHFFCDEDRDNVFRYQRRITVKPTSFQKKKLFRFEFTPEAKRTKNIYPL